MVLNIQVVKLDGQPQLHTFTKAEVLIGRKPDNDLVLGGQDVSGAHACLQVEGDCLTLFDLRSTNGTFVNGQRISVSAQLGPDDEITIAEFTLRANLADLRPRPPINPVSPVEHAVPRPEAVPAPPEPEPPPRPRYADVDGPPLARELPPRSPVNSLDTEGLPPVVGDGGRQHREQRRPSLDTDGLPPVVARPRSPRSGAPQPSSSVQPPPSVRPPSPVPPAVAAPATPSPTPRTTAVPPQPTSRPAASIAPRAVPDTDLTHAWRDPTVRRIFIMGLARIELERDGVRLPLPHSFGSVDDLSDQLSALCGHPVRCATSERVLADGTVVQSTDTSEFGPYVVVTRPKMARPVGLDALVQDQVLPAAAAELLAACVRVRLPVLLAALPGAAAAPMVAALLGAIAGPTALVRGLPAPILTPHGCTAFDVGHGEGRMASVVRLALAGDVQWLGVDEPEPAALDECAWAAARGCGVVVGLRAESLAHALRRARASGAGADGPAIPYALVALLAPAPSARDNGAGTANLRWLGELRAGDGPNNVHELFTTGRRGDLILTAVPYLLGELGERGVGLAPELFALD